MVLWRPNAWWLSPFIRDERAIMPSDCNAQFLLTRCIGGYYMLIILITTQMYWTALHVEENGALMLRCVNNTGEVQNANVSFSMGSNPLDLIKQTMNHIITCVLG